ncbi:MAG: hypothetical protein QOG02_374, partial [Gaiellales bacterium]|nr:hypothetical protein [Gaiellales bacterium]
GEPAAAAQRLLEALAEVLETPAEQRR